MTDPVNTLEGIPHIDLAELDAALRRLERPSIGARIANVVGSPVEKLIAMLPARAPEAIAAAARQAVHGALKLSLRTLAPHDPRTGPPPRAAIAWHKIAGAASGAAGGAFGLAALAVELPVSTTI